MGVQRRANLVIGLILVVVGGWFLATQIIPGLGDLVRVEITWPLLVVGSGILLLVLGLLVGAPALAVPATIVSGIGGILYWQNITGNWESWSYVWALIPGFVGAGIIFSGLLQGRLRSALREGGGLLVFSLVMFSLFAAFLGGWNLFGDYWPVLLIILGLWWLVKPMLSR